MNIKNLMYQKIHRTFAAAPMTNFHDSKLRVRYEETDTMQVVYYGKYLVWFEVGRINLLRDIGLVYREWEARGLRFPVVEAHASYHAPARFDDEVIVRTKVANVGNSSMKFENKVYKLPEKELLCSGYTVHVLIDGVGRSRPIPDDIRERLTSS
jgi:acyl-CoA thioester hydrolase